MRIRRSIIGSTIYFFCSCAFMVNAGPSVATSPSLVRPLMEFILSLCFAFMTCTCIGTNQLCRYLLSTLCLSYVVIFLYFDIGELECSTTPIALNSNPLLMIYDYVRNLVQDYSGKVESKVIYILLSFYIGLVNISPLKSTGAFFTPYYAVSDSFYSDDIYISSSEHSQRADESDTPHLSCDDGPNDSSTSDDYSDNINNHSDDDGQGLSSGIQSPIADLLY